MRTAPDATLASTRIVSSALRWPQKQRASVRKHVVPRAASISSIMRELSGNWKLQPDGMADQLSWEAVAGIAGVNWRRHHPVQLATLLSIHKPASSQVGG